MKRYCPNCGTSTLHAVNYDRGETICRSCEYVQGF